MPWTEDEMVLGIDLYRTDDYVKDRRVELLPILRPVFADLLGEALEDVLISLHLHNVVDLRELDGSPSVVNLRGSHGYVTVRIARHGRLLYQHPHSMREILGRPLQRLLAEYDPAERHWGFGISGPGLEHLTMERPAPRVEGVQLLPAPGRNRVFHLEEVPEPDPPTAGLADFGIAPPDGAGGAGEHDRVVLVPEVYERLLHTMEFSDDVEDGGFLVGQVFADRDRPGGHLIQVTEAVPAERTGASLLHFTFTGESFLRVNDAIARRGPEFKLVGWYHTHLFPATDAVGLSSIDVELHARTFLRRWHIAALVNIDGGHRTLRAYQLDGASMALLPFWVGAAWTP